MFEWSPPISPWLPIVAIIVALLGSILATWAMLSNAFFSMIVRIQDDRGHTVASGGPYRFVRHPSYIGTIFSWACAAMALGSWLALLPVVLIAVTFTVRTALEDRMLQEELPGYKEYAGRVRYRLLPGVW